MNPVNKFLDHLISYDIFPFEKVIADSQAHVFTDARSGRRYTYAIYDNGQHKLVEITCRAA